MKTRVSGLAKLKSTKLKAIDCFIDLISNHGNKNYRIPKRYHELVYENARGNYELKPHLRKLFKVGITGGKFEILHYGHVQMLKKAKELCDVLIVILANDELIKKLKKRNPLQNQSERTDCIKALRYVDVALVGDRDLNYKYFLELIKPDILFYGYDQKRITIIQELNFKVKEIVLPKFGEANTTKIINNE
ncbi:MAG: adenylyltransferase/cytidyltransferase family protein [Candidatus Micrarchaeota archaeon]|nr:adenylyltransferase/cytidyltransferase family protein [Candidatus Micrarchaeota archaeon]